MEDEEVAESWEEAADSGVSRSRHSGAGSGGTRRGEGKPHGERVLLREEGFGIPGPRVGGGERRPGSRSAWKAS